MPLEDQKPNETMVLASAIAAQLDSLDARAPAAGLYLVATPIGNLSDITLRALWLLMRADTVYCEDTRQTRKLTERYGLSPRLRPYHDHNADEVRPHILAALAKGEAIALVSDAGTPLVSDPGHKLVRDARAAGHSVYAIPGPSAVLAGLTLSGLEIDRFFFEGFLPPKEIARRSRLETLRSIPGTLVFFETANRLAASLADMAAMFGARRAVIARELTKLHEDVQSGPLPDLASAFATSNVRGEMVILVGPPDKAADVTDAMLRAALEDRLQTMSLKDASKELADHFGVPRKRIYTLGLARSGDKASE